MKHAATIAIAFAAGLFMWLEGAAPTTLIRRNPPATIPLDQPTPPNRTPATTQPTPVNARQRPPADFLTWAHATNNPTAWTPTTKAIWPTCRRIKHLKTFILGYQGRARTSANLTTNLVTELDPYRQWMDETFGQDEEIWRLITSYQNEVDDTIRNYGAEAAQRDDEPSRWPLFRALTEASRPYYEVLTDEDTLPAPIPYPGTGQERSRCGG